MPRSKYGESAELLYQGDVIRYKDGSTHYIQYVNSSGAYAVPLSAVMREIGDRAVAFTAGGKTISARSLVERIDPLSLGSTSQEYRRYVKMATGSDLKEGTMGTRRKGKSVDIDGSQGAPLGEFDHSDLSGSDAADGHSADGESLMPASRGKQVAKKANGKAKTAKPTKEVRKCACGCSAETTGFFAPGHDARMHGWIKKLADGRMEPKELPAGIAKKLDLVATKEGHRAKSPHFWRD